MKGHYHEFVLFLWQLSVMTTEELRKRIPEKFRSGLSIWGTTLNFAIFYLVLANRVFDVELTGMASDEYRDNSQGVLDALKRCLIGADFPNTSKEGEEFMEYLLEMFDTRTDLHVRSYSELQLQSEIGGPDMTHTFQGLLMKDLGEPADSPLGAHILSILEPSEGSFISQLVGASKEFASIVTQTSQASERTDVLVIRDPKWVVLRQFERAGADDEQVRICETYAAAAEHCAFVNSLARGWRDIIRITGDCPHCGHQHDSSVENAGKTVRCRCQTMFLFPTKT